MNLLFSFDVIEVPHQGTLCRKWKEISEVNTTACYDSEFYLSQNNKGGEHKKLRYKKKVSLFKQLLFTAIISFIKLRILKNYYIKWYFLVSARGEIYVVLLLGEAYA